MQAAPQTWERANHGKLNNDSRPRNPHCLSGLFVMSVKLHADGCNYEKHGDHDDCARPMPWNEKQPQPHKNCHQDVEQNKRKWLSVRIVMGFFGSRPCCRVYFNPSSAAKQLAKPAVTLTTCQLPGVGATSLICPCNRQGIGLLAVSVRRCHCNGKRACAPFQRCVVRTARLGISAVDLHGSIPARHRCGPDLKF